MKVAVYARISTADQNVDMQLRDLRAYCKQRGWGTEEFIDRGVSGAKASRVQLDRLMVAARRREFDSVVVWRFDRFARSTKHLLSALEEFQALGINFISHQEAIDSSTPLGKMMFTLVSAMAEMERALIIERVRAGIANARSEGKELGRPKRVFRRDTALELRAAGHSWRSIARLLGVPASTVRHACADCAKNPAEDGSRTTRKHASKTAAA
jgi:DNA invertase Pin-like site-specific DNA recombinase